MGNTITNRAGLVILLSARNSRDGSDTWLDELPKTQKKQLREQGGSKLAMADLLMQRVVSGRGPDNGHAVSTGKTPFRGEKIDMRGKRAARLSLRKVFPQREGGEYVRCLFHLVRHVCPCMVLEALEKEPFSYMNGDRTQTDREVKSALTDGGACLV